MDYTSRMTSLLSELRRERNGAAADAMRFYGKAYGLNLGVAIHTIRSIIADMPHDNDFARYLYRQDVRELKIAALWLAEPGKVGIADADEWRQGIINSEIAEQAAMALFSKVECVDELVAGWSAADDVLAVYVTLLAISRNARCDVRRALTAIDNVVDRFPDNRLVGQAAVTAIASLYERAPEATTSVAELIKEKKTPTAMFINDELSWRL